MTDSVKAVLDYFDHMLKVDSQLIQHEVRHIRVPEMQACLLKAHWRSLELLKSRLPVMRQAMAEGQPMDINVVRGFLDATKPHVDQTGGMILSMAVGIHNRVVRNYGGMNGMDYGPYLLFADDDAAREMACMAALETSVNRSTVEFVKRVYQAIARNNKYDTRMTAALDGCSRWWQARLKTLARTYCHEAAGRARLSALAKVGC